MLKFLLKRKSVLLLCILFLLTLTLLARDIERREGGGLFDRISMPLFSYPLRLSTLCINRVVALWEHYLFLVNVRSENARLTRTINNLQLENHLLKEEALENSRLRALLGLKKKLPYSFIPAAIIGRDPSSWFQTLLLDKGTAQGIRRGYAVMTSRGMVGKVLEVHSHAAKVLLIIDSTCALDILVQRSRAKGIIEGRTLDRCELSYVAKTEDIRVGDAIVTSGLNEMIPKGIVVGEVIQVKKNTSGFFQLVEVKPAVDFSRLEEVLVVVP